MALANATEDFVDALGVRWGGGEVFVFVSRSRRQVALESVTFMSWEASIFSMGFERDGW